MREKTKKKSVSVIKIVLIVLLAIIISGTAAAILLERTKIKFSLLGDPEITIEVNDEYKEEGFIATERKRDISNKVKVKSNLDTNKVGDYKIKYNLKIIYLYINKTLVRMIHIKDTQKPVLNIQSAASVTVFIGETYEYPAYYANDNYDGDITKDVKVSSDLDVNKKGTYEINYTVSDSSNNVTEAKIIVNVKEKTKNPYIKVSISEQKLYYYEYEELVLSTPVVTGKNSTPTPTGNYKVLNKARNVTLRGSNYTSFVNYWIAFIGHSYGIHDASWRDTYGGTIYKNNGSHGCVNTPLDKVKQLYDLVEIGTPVYVYN